MLLWNPQPTGPNSALPFFWIPLFWGVSDAVIQTQINVIYGSFFGDSQDAAFGNYRFWESLGFIFVFGYQGYLCVYIKLYILIGMILISAVSYIWCEAVHFKVIKQE